MQKSLSQRSYDSIWHPFTQMKTAQLPITITEGKGAKLYDDKGNIYIDAISSWWTNIHGHSHPYIAEKLSEQALKLEHVIFAGFTHEPAITLSERLIKKLPPDFEKVFFSDNGSTAVEVGLKMAFQYWFNIGQKRTKVIALDGAYHGDTFGSMSVSGRSAFNEPFNPFMFDVEYLPNPGQNSETDVLSKLHQIIESNKNQIACFVYEPLVMGAGGMLMYSPELLNQIMKLCHDNNILCLADEVMVGFYRTGKMFASEYMTQKPDLMALSKGLTGGTMALGITACTAKIYDAFLSNDKMKTFFHGHSFTANPLACAVSNASMDLLEKDECQLAIEQIQKAHKTFAKEMLNLGKYENIRQRGTILAMDVKSNEATSYFNNRRDAIYEYALSKGVILRPLGNTLYVLPPYCITKNELEKVYEVIKKLDL